MNEIITSYPEIQFASSSQFVWSPTNKTVFYDETACQNSTGKLALLHEIGHAELGHHDYTSDIGLLNMEMDAWEYAIAHAPRYQLPIDEAHIERCLETYRMWLYKRSRCPECQFHGVQTTAFQYRCFMCRHTWEVARSLSVQPQRNHCQPVQARSI